MSRISITLACIVWAALVGCTGPQNPSFEITIAEAKAVIREMKRDPRALDRPVIIASGLFDMGFDVSGLASLLRRMTTGDDMITTATFMSLSTGSFDGCRDHLIRKVEDTFGTTGTRKTIEVDVIGISMGGLVARHASRPRTDGGKRLTIRRLFTISTPHRGARLAAAPTLGSRTIDMRAGSTFLAELDEALPLAEYDMYSYARLGDWIVGVENTAPPGRTAWWVPTPPLSLAHVGAADDPRILADIARRLRGEMPFTVEPPAPLSEVPDKARNEASPSPAGT